MSNGRHIIGSIPDETAAMNNRPEIDVRPGGADRARDVASPPVGLQQEYESLCRSCGPVVPDDSWRDKLTFLPDLQLVSNLPLADVPDELRDDYVKEIPWHLQDSVRYATDGMQKHMDQLFERFDVDGDNFLSEAEIDKAPKAYVSSTLKYLRNDNAREQVANLSDDEFGWENDGVSKEDADRLVELFRVQNRYNDQLEFLNENIHAMLNESDLVVKERIATFYLTGNIDGQPVPQVGLDGLKLVLDNWDRVGGSDYEAIPPFWFGKVNPVADQIESWQR